MSGLTGSVSAYYPEHGGTHSQETKQGLDFPSEGDSSITRHLGVGSSGCSSWGETELISPGVTCGEELSGLTVHEGFPFREDILPY